MRILISAGEASGEFYGAELMQALRRQLSQTEPNTDIEFFGVGGDLMRAAGCDLLVDAKEIAEVGIVEVVKHIPTIYRRFRQVVREAERRRPDAAVLIDFPDFNLRLARELHQRGVPVIYYVSPQLWAWKQRRIERVRKYVRQMLVIFPFEERFYHERGITAQFVGHPLADLPAPSVTREQFAAEYKLIQSANGLRSCPAAGMARFRGFFPYCCKRRNFLALTTFTPYRSLPLSRLTGSPRSCAAIRDRRLRLPAMPARPCCMPGRPWSPAELPRWKRP